MKENDCSLFFETSAKTGENIEIVLNLIVKFNIKKNKKKGISRDCKINFYELCKYANKTIFNKWKIREF